jgi:molybdopterin converting factor small subunit
MTILVKFFGDLRKKIKEFDTTNSLPLNLYINSNGINTISDILDKFGIEKVETGHLFVNGIYSGFKKKVKDGDRVGLFPNNMKLLYKWYFTRHEDE